MPKVVVVVPTYNEADNIVGFITQVLEYNPGLDILVVDDSSPDGTGRIVKELQRKYKQLNLISRPTKDGLGRAYITGFKRALLHNNYDFVVQMDADHSHRPLDLARLLGKVNGQDLVIGSRYVKDGAIVGWDLTRRVLSYLGNLYTRLFLGLEIHDWTSGFNVWSSRLLEQLPLEKLNYKGYFFQIALKYYAKGAGGKIKEAPIIFKERLYGQSKLNLGTLGEALNGVLKLALKERTLK